MSSRSLPPRPSLLQLKRQATEPHQEHRAKNPSAAARILAHHPRLKRRSLAAILDDPFTLADAQVVLAREYGFPGWPALKHHVEIGTRVAAFTKHPQFDEALAALDDGDSDRLQGLIQADPSLLVARTNLEPPYHYFTGATLLHHVAGNPGRPPHTLSRDIVDIARLLLEAGAEVDAATLGPNAGTTMGLVITSKQANDAGVTAPLMDLLLAHGASLDVRKPDVLDAPLANHAPQAAEQMIALGATPDLAAAAALGRMDLLRAAFDAQGRLRSRVRRHGKVLPDRDAIGLALLFAYVGEQHEAVDFLLDKDGNWNVTGVNNGTVLHRAAQSGDLAMVQRLVAKGADTSNRDNPFAATPLSWANHDAQVQVVEWMRRHCAIDLHDAVSFDLPGHVHARLREDPGSVNLQRDQWRVPHATPLHLAATLDREALTTVLLDAGADPNILAGNGLAALDLAEQRGAAGVAALIAARGGKHAGEL